MDQAVGRREKTEETGKMPVLRLGADKARRRITFEALDSGTPRVANVGNLGDVRSALFHRGETPRHFRLILRRQALSALIFFFFVGIVNIFFVHALLDRTGLPVAIFLVLANFFLAYFYRDAFKPLLTPKYEAMR